MKAGSLDGYRSDAPCLHRSRLLGMSAMSLGVRRRQDVVDLIMVTIYVILTAYLFASGSPSRIALTLRDAVTPFQIKARARNAEAERSAAAWRPLRLETRTRGHYC